jgi:hypothetical protein
MDGAAESGSTHSRQFHGCNVNSLTSAGRRLPYSLIGAPWWCGMKNKLDAITAVSAVGVAVYAAIAMGYVAQYGFGFSLEEIRGAAMLTAVVLTTAIAIEFFGKKFRKN